MSASLLKLMLEDPPQDPVRRLYSISPGKSRTKGSTGRLAVGALDNDRASASQLFFGRMVLVSPQGT
jgi:hypothetical protein